MGRFNKNADSYAFKPLITKFSLNQDDFETLMAYFTPKEDILKILNVSYADMDEWCRQVYHLSYNDVYDNMLALARTQGRMMISRLADQGNNTAMNIYSKYFAKYEEEQQNKADTIPIIAVIPLDKPNNNKD